MEDELSRLLEIRAKVKVKAKSLNMTTLKNATKILDPGLSVLHHRKRLALTHVLVVSRTDAEAIESSKI